MNEATEFLLQALQNGVLKKAVFSKCNDKTILKSVLTPKIIGGKQVCQLETFHKDNKATQQNKEDCSEAFVSELLGTYGQVNFFTTVGDWEYRNNGKSQILLGKKNWLELFSSAEEKAELGGNNQEKNRILSGKEPFLQLLEISDSNGRIHDKKQSKFRQINRFLELVSEIVPELPKTGELHICDLCCGKSYLSFAVYHYFTNILHRQVRMEGVDLKADVVAYCNDVAQKLHFNGLTFTCMDVSKFQTDLPVHLVVSLHACDIATDFVLEKATEWKTDVILSTPCCHHEMNHHLIPSAVPFIKCHSMLRQKFCDAATDALRLKRLQARGYRVCALELIDPEETPKNVMLRAVKRDNFDPNGVEAKALWAEYYKEKKALVGDCEVHF